MTIKMALIVAAMLANATTATAQTYSNNFSFVDRETRKTITGTISGLRDGADQTANGLTITLANSGYSDLNRSYTVDAGGTNYDSSINHYSAANGLVSSFGAYYLDPSNSNVSAAVFTSDALPDNYPNISNQQTGHSVSNSVMGVTFSRVAVSQSPEPSTWSLMILGFGIIGGALRRQKRRLVFQQTRQAG